MAFRADEAARTGFEQANSYLLQRLRNATYATLEHSKTELQCIMDDLGPVVAAYPSWHPLVFNHSGPFPVTTPNDLCGYHGLDHTVLFRNGFITCPYSDAEKVIESVNALPRHPVFNITAEALDVQLYSPESTPVLVQCDWGKPLEEDGMIPLSVAVPLILEKELPFWHRAEVAETWETMRPYFLGSPHGSRSSLFVSQQTGNTIKTIWNALISTGMFGPIKF